MTNLPGGLGSAPAMSKPSFAEASDGRAMPEPGDRPRLTYRARAGPFPQWPPELSAICGGATAEDYRGFLVTLPDLHHPDCSSPDHCTCEIDQLPEPERNAVINANIRAYLATKSAAVDDDDDDDDDDASSSEDGVAAPRARGGGGGGGGDDDDPAPSDSVAVSRPESDASPSTDSEVGVVEVRAPPAARKKGAGGRAAGVARGSSSSSSSSSYSSSSAAAFFAAATSQTSGKNSRGRNPNDTKHADFLYLPLEVTNFAKAVLPALTAIAQYLSPWTLETPFFTLFPTSKNGLTLTYPFPYPSTPGSVPTVGTFFGHVTTQFNLFLDRIENCDDAPKSPIPFCKDVPPLALGPEDCSPTGGLATLLSLLHVAGSLGTAATRVSESRASRGTERHPLQPARKVGDRRPLPDCYDDETLLQELLGAWERFPNSQLLGLEVTGAFRRLSHLATKMLYFQRYSLDQSRFARQFEYEGLRASFTDDGLNYCFALNHGLHAINTLVLNVSADCYQKMTEPPASAHSQAGSASGGGAAEADAAESDGDADSLSGLTTRDAVAGGGRAMRSKRSGLVADADSSSFKRPSNALQMKYFGSESKYAHEGCSLCTRQQDIVPCDGCSGCYHEDKAGCLFAYKFRAGGENFSSRSIEKGNKESWLCPMCAGGVKLREITMENRLDLLNDALLYSCASPLFVSAVSTDNPGHNGVLSPLHIAAEQNNDQLLTRMLYGVSVLDAVSERVFCRGPSQGQLCWPRDAKKRTPFQRLYQKAVNSDSPMPTEALYILAARGDGDMDAVRRATEERAVRLGFPQKDNEFPQDDISEGKERFNVPWVNDTGDGMRLQRTFVYVTRVLESEYVRINYMRCLNDGPGVATLSRKHGRFGGGLCDEEVEKKLRSEQCIAQQFRCECNFLCACVDRDPQPNEDYAMRMDYRPCNNQYSLEGLRFPIEVFRCGESKGWGARTQRGVTIKAGEIVCCYVGICRTEEEVEAWNESYTNKGMHESYIMDCASSNEGGGAADEEATRKKSRGPSRRQKYAIDATEWRSVSAFFNHTCSEPNIELARGYRNHLEKDVPIMMFKAKRNIYPLEELLFNYGTKPFGDNCLCQHCENARGNKESKRAKR